jgi:hypothetical protein
MIIQIALGIVAGVFILANLRWIIPTVLLGGLAFAGFIAVVSLSS